MTVRIERSKRQGFTVFALSGRTEAEQVAELTELLIATTAARQRPMPNLSRNSPAARFRATRQRREVQIL
jgi:hypothetical protein